MIAILALAVGLLFVTSAGQGSVISLFRGSRYRITSSKRGLTTSDLQIVREGLPRMGFSIHGEDVENIYYDFTAPKDMDLRFKSKITVTDELGSVGVRLSIDDVQRLS